MRLKWIFISTISFLVLWWVISSLNMPHTLSKKLKQVDTTVTKILSTQKIRDTNIRQELYKKLRVKRLSFGHIYKEYTVPGSFSLKDFQEALKNSVKRTGCELEKSQIDFGKDRNTLIAEISFKGYGLFSLKLIQRLPSKKITYKEPALMKPYLPAYVAIVIDDWGYSLNNLKSLSEIKNPLTLAVLPNLPYSERIAKEAYRKNFEVILHIPMEAHSKNVGNEKDTILTSMDKKAVISTLNNSIKSVPYIKGISNHQGSKATEDEALIKIILEELKNRNLFFLDSFVTPNSVCETLARSSGIKFAKRSAFLDNEEDPEYIKTQLRHLAYLAKKDGSAIGICHDREVTFSVLSETMKELEAEGIKFVKLSELVK